MDSPLNGSGDTPGPTSHGQSQDDTEMTTGQHHMPKRQIPPWGQAI